MCTETWMGKTGQVIHQGFLEISRKPKGSRKRFWCKLLFAETKKQSWLVFLRISDKSWRDVSSEELIAELDDRPEHPDPHQGLMTAQEIVSLDELDKLTYSEAQIELHSGPRNKAFDVLYLFKADEELSTWNAVIGSCVPRFYGIESEKRKLSGQLFGKKSKYAVSAIGNFKDFPKDCYVITHTQGQGAMGKFRIGMPITGPEKMIAIKEFRTVAKTGPVTRGEGAKRAVVPKLKKTTKSDIDEIKEELDLMKRIGTKLDFIRMLRIGTKLYGVMPLMVCDLNTLRGLEGVSPNEKKLVGRYVALELAEDLNKCNKAGYVHHDLKPGNVFVHVDRVALADFGGCLTREETQRHDKLSGTPEYWPWEMFSHKENTQSDLQFDTFALGMLWAELLSPVKDGHFNRSTAWPLKKGPLKEHAKHPIIGALKSGSNKDRFEPIGRLWSAWCGYYESHSVYEFPHKDLSPFNKGMNPLQKADPELFELVWEGMLQPDFRQRAKAEDIVFPLTELVNDAGGKGKARTALKKIVQKGAGKKKYRKQRSIKAALLEARKVYEKRHKEMLKAAKRNLYRCVYCKAEFRYKPTWCSCGRPANTSDGSTFESIT